MRLRALGIILVVVAALCVSTRLNPYAARWASNGLVERGHDPTGEYAQEARDSDAAIRSMQGVTPLETLGIPCLIGGFVALAFARRHRLNP